VLTTGWVLEVKSIYGGGKKRAEDEKKKQSEGDCIEQYLRYTVVAKLFFR
jgi:hypothetical protein